MKITNLLLPVGMLAVVSVAGGGQFAATLVSANSPCRPSEVKESEVGYAPGNPVTSALPTGYSDNGQHYAGVCGGTAGPTASFVQVNDAQGAAAGRNSLVDGQTGQAAVDNQIWAYGPASFWIAGGGPAAPKPGCAPAGDDKFVYANGNNVTRELPTVYTDGGVHHVGACGGGDRLQFNEPGSAHRVVIEGAPAGVPTP